MFLRKKMIGLCKYKTHIMIYKKVQNTYEGVSW